MVRKRPGPATRRTLRTVRVPGFTLTEGVHPAGSALPWHSHDTPTICFVLRGAFTEVSAGESLTCTPATLKVMPAGERHCDRFDRGDAQGLLIETDPGRVDMFRPYGAVLNERIAVNGGLPAAVARRLYQEFRADDEAAPLAVEGLLLELLAAAARASAAGEPRGTAGWLTEARDIIHATYAGPLSLSGLAEMVGVHPATLARGFRSRFGSSVGAYVRRVRIERAAQQLGTGDRPLAAIALAAGFSDQSHFCNVFRQLTGMSPSAYRRAARPALSP
jgi:AraC family transcriptional regulator